MFALIALVAQFATLNLTYVDTGKTFTLPKQTTIVVTLASCHPCGYEWKLKPLNTSVVRRVSRRYVSTSHAVGAGGKEIWTFVTVGRGRDPIHLVYLRPFEHKPPARTFSVTINVS